MITLVTPPSLTIFVIYSQTRKCYSFLNHIFSFIKKWANLNFLNLLNKSNCMALLVKSVFTKCTIKRDFHPSILSSGVVFILHQHISKQKCHPQVKLVHICMIMAIKGRPGNQLLNTKVCPLTYNTRLK